MDRRQTGIYGEMIAARYLRKKKYEILQPNYHSRFGEIDLIAQQGDTIVFVEVKTRDSEALVSPAEAVNFSKQQRIKKTALCYLATVSEEVNVRYDVLEVLIVRKGIKKVKVRHIENAFY